MKQCQISFRQCLLRIHEFHNLSPQLSMPLVVRLNHTSMDDCKWTACLHSRDSASEVMTNKDYTPRNLGLQIVSHLDDMEAQMSMKKVYAEDLKILHHSLMHLEAHHARRERSSQY
jgi:hypothetical protein